MPRRKADVIETSVHETVPSVMWSKDDKESHAKAAAAYQDAYGACGIVDYAKGSSNPAWMNDFRNIDTNVNARSPFTREDYDYYRPTESIPTKFEGIIKACDMAYQRVGIIRNVIDLMGDFACQGITIVHPNPSIQEFYRGWFDMVNGRDRSERFLNTLYRLGNVVISRELGRVRKPDLDKIKKGKTKGAKQDFVDLSPDRPIYKNEIPLSYTFMDLCSVEVIGSSLSAFVGEPPQLGLRISSKLVNTILSPKSPEEKDLVAKLPAEIVSSIKSSKKKLIPLDPNLVSSYYYKKDDWKDWANPMLYSILDNLVTLEKMRLADLAALDGAISNIRLWKLGNAALGIAPNKAAAVRLSNMLTNNAGGGTIDLIWTDDIELQESKTNVHMFLGETKYAPVWQAIFQGLGIPATLAGAPNASGTTNNFISMKTLVERLEYGRSVLKSFWQKELNHIQEACGFRFAAQIHFEKMSLSDEVAEKALLIQMIDRNIISEEVALQMMGFIPNLERVRTKKEHKERKDGRRVPKASQWHDPEPENDLNKIALQSGQATPSQVGLELQPKKRGEVPLAEQQLEMQKQELDQNHELAKKQQTLDHELQKDQHEFDKSLKEKKQADDQKIKRSQLKKKKTGVPGQGRPKNSKDSKQRTRTVKPRTSAQLQLWAAEMQERITALVIPEYLKIVAKKNLRQLTSEEFDDLELRKFATLANLDAFTEVSDIQLLKAFKTKIPQVASDVYDIYSKSVANIKSPTTGNMRQLQIIAYARAQRRRNG